VVDRERRLRREGTDDEFATEIEDGEIVEVEYVREMKRKLFVT
jgi:hypothetical protein